MNDSCTDAPVLVTGATGFIGSHLVRRLVADGAEVHIITRPGSSLTLLDTVASRLQVHVHDGSTRGLITIARAARPAIVFHLAAAFVAEHRSEDVELLVSSNVLFGAQLAEAMLAAGCHRLVNTGTSWQHFENIDNRPVTLYAATKQAFEDVLRYYTDATPLRAVSLHLFDTYGPRDPRPKLFRLLARLAASGEPLAMSPGEQHLDLVHVDDVVEAFLAAGGLLCRDEVKGHAVYAVTAAQTLSLRELAELYGRLAGAPLAIEWGGRPYREREVMRPWSTGTPVPGWRPSVSLEEGISRMLRNV